MYVLKQKYDYLCLIIQEWPHKDLNKDEVFTYSMCEKQDATKFHNKKQAQIISKLVNEQNNEKFRVVKE